MGKKHTYTTHVFLPFYSGEGTHKKHETKTRGFSSQDHSLHPQNKMSKVKEEKITNEKLRKCSTGLGQSMI